MLDRSREFWMKVCNDEPDGYISAGDRSAEYKIAIDYMFDSAEPENRVKRLMKTTSSKAFTVTSLLLASALITGCQTTKPTIVTKIVERKVEIPKSLKTCEPEPVADVNKDSQKYASTLLNDVAKAGNDCRIKFYAIQKYIK